MEGLNFKTSLAPGRERFLTASALLAFTLTEEDSSERFEVIYNDLKMTETLPFDKRNELKNTKTIDKSYNLRLLGNEQFSINIHEALIFYSKSIAAAPYPMSETDVSTELAIAFAERSSVYAKMDRHEAALKDIEQALIFQYPDNLKCEFFERRTRCYQALGMLNEAIKSCQEAIHFLPLLEAPTTDKMGLLTSALKKLNVRKHHQQNRQVTRTLPPPKKTYGQHKELTGASDCLDIKYSKEYGHHVVSTRDINPGDIVIVEEPYVSLPGLEYDYRYCCHCLKRCDAMIPCKHCSLVMFCSEDCRNLAWGEYHRIECSLLPLLKELDIGQAPMALAALRMLLVSTSKHADHSLCQLYKIVTELEVANKNNKGRSGYVQRGQPFVASFDYAGVHYLDQDRRFFDVTKYSSRSDNMAPSSEHPGNKNILVFLVTAINCALIVNCLDSYSDFFHEPKKTTSEPSPFEHPSPNDLKIFAGRLMMRYTRIIESNTKPVVDYQYNATKKSFEGKGCGFALHYTLCFLNHSCCNNTTLFHYNGNTAFVVALQPIKKGDQLFVNYWRGYPNKNRFERASFLSDLNMVCCCEACLNNWPTGAEMLLELQLICSKCKAPLSSEPKASIRCPKCQTKKNLAKTLKTQTSMAKRLQVIREGMHTHSGFMQDFSPELSKYLTFMFENFQMPNLIAIALQRSLSENYRRWSNYNYSGGWAP